MGNLYFRAWRRYLAGPCFVVQAAKAFWQSAETSECRDKVDEAVFGGERGTIGGKRGRADKVCFDIAEAVERLFINIKHALCSKKASRSCWR